MEGNSIRFPGIKASIIFKKFGQSLIEIYFINKILNNIKSYLNYIHFCITFVSMSKKLPIYCPSCENSLKVESLICDNCKTTVSGCFDIPMLLQLSTDQQLFIIDFMKCSGSLKEMATKLGLSYPTVRNMLDAIITEIQKLQNQQNYEN